MGHPVRVWSYSPEKLNFLAPYGVELHQAADVVPRGLFERILGGSEILRLIVPKTEAGEAAAPHIRKRRLATTGGVVEQDSKRPKLDPFINGTVVFGTDATKRSTVDVNQPLPELGQGAAIRLNAMIHDSGFAGRDVVENLRGGIAPSLALGLGTPTRITLNYLHQSEYDTPDYGLPWLYQGRTSTVGATTVASTALARPSPLSLTSSKYYGFENGNYLRTNVDIATAKIEHDINNSVTVSEQLRYARYVRQFDITEPQVYTPATANGRGVSGTALLITPGTPLSTINVSRNQLYGTSLEDYLVSQTDVAARFTTGTLDHSLRAGIELGRENSDPVRYTTIAPYSQTPLLSPNPGNVDNAFTFLSTRTQTFAGTQAGYVLDTIKFDDQWSIMGGLRYERFDAIYDQVAYPNPVTRAPVNTTHFLNTNYELSWRGAVVYKPLPNASVYFDAGTSFNPSAEALSLSLATAALPPEKNTSYEVGSKWEFLDGNLLFTAALFQTTKENLREPDPNNSLFNILAGTGVAKGGELELQGHITPEWQIIAGYAYTYGVITKSPTTGPASDLGHRLANVPAHTGNLWTTYDLPASWGIGKWQVGGGLNVVSSRFASTTPTTAGSVAFFKEIPGYFTLNAMAKYQLTEKVALQVNITNLTDNKFYDQIHPSHVVPGAGTTALFTLAYKL